MSTHVLVPRLDGVEVGDESVSEQRLELAPPHLPHLSPHIHTIVSTHIYEYEDT